MHRWIRVFSNCLWWGKVKIYEFLLRLSQYFVIILKVVILLRLVFIMLSTYLFLYINTRFITPKGIWKFQTSSQNIMLCIFCSFLNFMMEKCWMHAVFFWILFYFLYSSFLLYILYILVDICQSQSPNSSPHCFPPLVSICLFSTSVSLFLPCKPVHLYHFSRFHIYALIYDICFSLSDFTLFDSL